MPLKSFFIPVSFSCLMILTAFNNPFAVRHVIKPEIFKDTIPRIDSAADKIFDKVEIEASFPGGDEAWRNFLERNINAATPAEYGAPAGTYTVVVQFVVDKEGKISDIKALTRHGYGMEAEVIKLLRKAPNWTPALQDGRHVKAYRKQPVTFQIVYDRKKKRKN